MTLDAAQYDTDKVRLRHYLVNYEQKFAALQNEPVRLLELGVYRGGSLLMWRDYFPRGTIVGLDVNPVVLDDASGRVRFFQGEQQDLALLDRIGAETAPGGFDIIIDDCSHIGALSRASFRHLFAHHLKPGGTYAIEDWGTGYWPSWPDGALLREDGGSWRTAAIARLDNLLYAGAPGTPRALTRAFRLSRRLLYPRRLPSHDHGMVGFIKELVDECGMGDATHPGLGRQPHRASRIAALQISHGHVFVTKAAGATAPADPAAAAGGLS